MSTKIALKSFMTSRPGMLSGKIRVHILHSKQPSIYSVLI